MPAIGGSAETLAVNGREFPYTADADINRKNGGYENEVGANGNGTGRILKTRVNPMLSGNVVECDESRDDHQFLQDISDGNGFVVIAITYAGGEVYEGTAIITGELQHSSQNATLSFDMTGQGKFTKQ